MRLAALKALGIVGGESSVKLLVEQALTAVGKTPEGDEARGSLVRLPDARVSEVLAGMLARRTASEKVELIRILAARNASTVVERLKHMAVDADETVRLESWKALEVLAQESDGEQLLKLLVHAAEAEREAAEAAVVAVLKKAARPDASRGPRAGGGESRYRQPIVRGCGSSAPWATTADCLPCEKRLNRPT